jgi:hypothetical protein
MTLQLDLPVEPWIVVARADDRTVHECLSACSGIVRHLDSASMIEPAGLFAEFAEKLEFPAYFGHNWYALVDCLDDLHGSWHGGRAVVVVVEAADVLVGREFFPLFIALLCEAAERANLSLDADGEPRTRPPFPLHFVFLMDRFDPAAVADRLRTRDNVLVDEREGRLLIVGRPE